MYQGKYGAAIGFKKSIAWKSLLGTIMQKDAFLGQSQRCIGPGTYIKPRHFAKRQ
jgi:hypothetical protein